MKLTDLFIRRPVLAIVVNLRHRHRRAAGDPHAQRAPVPAARERDDHRHAPSTSAPTPIWCAASSPRRSSASIAAADGIDYIESQSVQGLSTINVRLKLNFNAADALADISARVEPGARRSAARGARCRRSPSSRPTPQFAAMYLSFGSDILEDNQVTDYLIRVVQPRLSAIDGRAARRHPGRPHVRDARLAQARPHGGAQRQPGAGAPGAGRQQLPRRPSARPRARWSRSTSPPTTDLRSVEEFKQLVHPRAGRRAGAAGRRRRRRARAPTTTTRTCASRARRPCSWASGCCPTPTRST